MPSSYSPSLRIELIAPGEQAGTWGTTTNTNLGTLVEDAISGYVSVAVSSANQALTALNGAADQARNAVLELVSAAQAFAIYAPPEPKQYTVFNNTSFVATIYNSTTLGNTTAAGAGVAIPAGKTMTVWSDGTDFAAQNTHIIGTVVGDVTGNVTGQLNGTITSATTAVTQAPGTSNTTIATTAFANAAFQGAYPVGSIYMNASVATNPGTLFGFGTWVAFGAGRVPVGFNAADPLFDTAEETGGSKDAIVVSHTHSATSVVTDPGHFHNGPTADEFKYYGNSGIVANGPSGLRSTDTIGITETKATGVTVATTNTSTGSSGTNANLQPYITVYMWKRTA
jgi:hypothetical protein